MFTAQEIKKRLQEQPFVPLRIYTSSGQSYDVHHPDLVLVGVRDLTVGVPSNDNATFYETTNRVAILHISEMQDLPVKSEGATNGSVAGK